MVTQESSNFGKWR